MKQKSHSKKFFLSKHLKKTQRLATFAGSELGLTKVILTLPTLHAFIHGTTADFSNSSSNYALNIRLKYVKNKIRDKILTFIFFLDCTVSLDKNS